MAQFDSLQRASFNGKTFPVEEVELEGGIRDHVHEYPHRPGGQPERMGRKLYTCRFQCTFSAGLKDFPGLWPDGLVSLREDFEQEKVGQLVIPTVGTISAYAFQWKQLGGAKFRSGERVTLMFREEPDDLESIASFLSSATTSSMSGATQNISDEAALQPPDILQTISQTIAQIDDAVNDVLALKDQADVYGNLLEAKLLHVADLCGAIDSALSSPAQARVLDAVWALWDTTIGVLKDLAGKKTDLQTFTVPKLLTVSDVSIALYGDATHAVEILQINPIEDAFAIPAGTHIRYYPAA